MTPKAGVTFELLRYLTGEVSVGYTNREYEDPTLQPLKGFVVDASLVWVATGLTTVTFTASTRTDESPLAGVSGALRRDVGVQVDHAFRRWLIGTVKLGYGQDDYVGLDRLDNRTSLAAIVTYKFSRELWLKGEFRQEWMNSNCAGRRLRRQHLPDRPEGAALTTSCPSSPLSSLRNAGAMSSRASA